MFVLWRSRKGRVSYRLPARYRENRGGLTPVANEVTLAQMLGWILWFAGLELPLSRGIRQRGWRMTGKRKCQSQVNQALPKRIRSPRCKPLYRSPCLCPCLSLSSRMPRCSSRWLFFGVYSVHRLLLNAADRPFRVLHLPTTRWLQEVIAFRNAWDLLEER
jgi:hypothetical protein